MRHVWIAAALLLGTLGVGCDVGAEPAKQKAPPQAQAPAKAQAPAQPKTPAQQKDATAMSATKQPACSKASEVPGLDGKEVLLEGTYRKRPSARKMGQPATEFMGLVNIELSGEASEIDARARPSAPAVIALGTEARPDDEVARFEGKRVQVLGTLALDPSKGRPPSQGARERPRPTLLQPHDLKAAQ